ncbi:MAG: hypothetical protein QW838_02880 [Candidatus Nitrosotenuis sp.]
MGGLFGGRYQLPFPGFGGSMLPPFFGGFSGGGFTPPTTTRGAPGVPIPQFPGGTFPPYPPAGQAPVPGETGTGLGLPGQGGFNVTSGTSDRPGGVQAPWRLFTDAQGRQFIEFMNPQDPNGPPIRFPLYVPGQLNILGSAPGVAELRNALFPRVAQDLLGPDLALRPEDFQLLYGGANFASGAISDVGRIGLRLEHLDPFQALPPDARAALSAMTRAAQERTALVREQENQQLVADLFGRGVPQSTIALDQAGRLTYGHSALEAQIMADAAQRELDLRQRLFENQLRSLTSAGQLGVNRGQLGLGVGQLGLGLLDARNTEIANMLRQQALRAELLSQFVNDYRQLSMLDAELAQRERERIQNFGLTFDLESRRLAEQAAAMRPRGGLLGGLLGGLGMFLPGFGQFLSTLGLF